jgi:hypothetical protein
MGSAKFGAKKQAALGFSQAWKAVIEGGWGAAVTLAKTGRKSLKGRLAK